MKTLTAKEIRHTFTLVEIMIVVAIIGVLAAIAIPNLMSNRAASMARTEEANAKMIKAAVNSFLSNTPTAATADGIVTTNFEPFLDSTLSEMAVGGNTPSVAINGGAVEVTYGNNAY